VISERFAPINGLNSKNSVLYTDDSEYANALLQCIEMSGSEYAKMQNNLKEYADAFYSESLHNLKGLINE
jgi:hypothetical protein